MKSWQVVCTYTNKIKICILCYILYHTFIHLIEIATAHVTMLFSHMMHIQALTCFSSCSQLKYVYIQLYE